MSEESSNGPEGRKEETPGRIYENTAQLCEDVDRLGSQTLRFYGQRLIDKPSTTRPGTSYFQIEEDLERPESFFDAAIYKIKYRDEPRYARFQMNVYAPDKTKYPKPVNWFEMSNENISQFRLEVLSRKNEKPE